MTIREALNQATSKLKKTSTPASTRRDHKWSRRGGSPQLDAEVLLCFALNKPKEYLYANPDQQLRASNYMGLIKKRAEGIPVAYLTNQKEFYGLNFYVDRSVLIPRPETEGLVELILSHRSSLIPHPSVLDIGTGSGAIIISLAKAFSNSQEFKNGYFASDISTAALKVARRNAKKYDVQITFKQGSLLKPWKKQKFDIIVANLPYLASETDVSTKFEPKSALIAAKQGLALYEDLFVQISSLNPARTTAVVQSGGTLPSSLIFEIGHDQASTIKKLAKKLLPAYKTEIRKDLTGRPRYAIIRFK
jgi:release factor glutamine methyltransferase